MAYASNKELVSEINRETNTRHNEPYLRDNLSIYIV